MSLGERPVLRRALFGGFGVVVLLVPVCPMCAFALQLASSRVVVWQLMVAFVWSFGAVAVRTPSDDQFGFAAPVCSRVNLSVHRWCGALRARARGKGSLFDDRDSELTPLVSLAASSLRSPVARAPASSLASGGVRGGRR